MADYEQNGELSVRTADLEGSKAWCHLMYALHAFSAAGGISVSATVVGAFLFSTPSIIAIILNYITRGNVRGTWLESHWRWQLRTFWFAVMWGLVAIFVTVMLIASLAGIIIYWLPMAVVGVWIGYRVIRGWLALIDKRPMPVPD